jgi:hypothetical protein
MRSLSSHFHHDPLLRYGGSNGEVRWLGLEPMTLIAKLTISIDLSLQEEYLLPLPVFKRHTIRKKQCGAHVQSDIDDMCSVWDVIILCHRLFLHTVDSQ